MSGVVKIFKMRITKRGWLGLMAIAAALIVAGCETLSNPDRAKFGGVDSNSQSARQMATPYNQPLMATGGDLAMLRLLRDVAGTWRAC